MPGGLTKDRVVEVFRNALGVPAKEQKKIIGWRVRPDLDLVIQLDSRQAADQIYVWIPAIEGGVTRIDCPCDLYAAGKSRHHNVARFSSLAANRWAIRVRPRTERDLLLIAIMVKDAAEEMARQHAVHRTIR